MEKQQDYICGRKRWLRVDELPFSRSFYVNHLRHHPDVVSITVKKPGSRKGVVLIDGDTLDRYLEKLAVQQAREGA